MINTSEAYKQQLVDDQRNFIEYIKIALKTGEVLNLSNNAIWSGGFAIEQSVSTGDSFPIGSAIINKLNLTLNNIYNDFSEYDFDEAVVDVSLGLELPDGTVEKLKKGIYVVDEPKRNGDLISLSCLDYISKFDRPYSESTLVYPVTRLQVIQDACEHCGVILKTVSFDGCNEVIQNRPSDDALTFRQVVAYVAQMCGYWVKCDENGHLELFWFDETALSSGNGEKITSINNISVADDDVVITGVKVITQNTDGETQDYLFGTTGYVLSIEGNDLISETDGNTVASVLGEKLIGIKFRPMEISILPDPSIEPGDIIVVIDRKGNEYCTVVTTVKFTNGDFQKISCDAESPGNNRSTQYTENTKTYVALRNLVKKEKNARQQAVDDLAKTLAESSGMYLTTQTQEDGSVISYLHDKPTLKESKNVIKLTAEAVGVSNDGGKTYPYGFTLTGALITRLLYAEGINADYIDTGALTVKDKDGNIVFKADMNTGQVTISGDHVSIGSQTATEAIQDALNKANEANKTAASAKNMAMSLSNDYQGIPVDADGNYETFPECKTQVTVMYGSTDVSGDCVYEVTQSAAVTGAWDKITRTYTVTGLAADSGWIDIKTTYLGTLAVSKRFTVAKQYAGKDGSPGKDGAPGSDGRTYTIESSASLLKIEPDGFHSPGVLTFSGYYLEGAESGRKTYAGRFVIEVSADGTTWDIVYQSDADESSVSYIVDLGLSVGNEDGAVLGDENGSILLAKPSNIAEIRCTLYAAGGTENVIDVISIPVVKSMDSLTQEEILDLLTNNGEAKGIYKIGNQLYVSFTYLRGEKLSLGGPNNGNGSLEILNNQGEVIVSGDNEGLKVIKGEIIGSEITGGKITGSRIYSISSDKFIALENGELQFCDGDLSSYSTYGKIVPSMMAYPDSMFDYGNVAIISIITDFLLGITISDNLSLYVTENTVRVNGDLEVTKEKSRVCNTKCFGERKLYAFETPTPYFGDIGSATTNEEGFCYVSIDDIFAETVSNIGEYQVFLQKEGPGDLWVDSKEPTHFCVKGTPDQHFSWEIKAAQRNYETLRLDDTALSFNNPNYERELEHIGDMQLAEYDKEMEELNDV